LYSAYHIMDVNWAYSMNSTKQSREIVIVCPMEGTDLPPMERRGFNLGVTGNNLRYRLKPNDRIYTPGPIAQSIVDMLTLQEGDVVLEPCYGGGAIYDRIPDGVEKRWCEIDHGRDFLEYEADDVDVIVTNPVS
jgi:hypothetical protein